MRYHRLYALLLTTCCLTGHLNMAQSGGAVAPIVPRTSVVLPPEKPTDIPVKAGMQPARSAAESASAPSKAAAHSRVTQPLYILNSTLIIGGELYIKPADINKLEVYKSPNVPAKWASLGANGLIVFTMKTKVKTKSWSFRQLGRRVGATGPVSYSVNGLPIAGAALRIATNAIGEIKITRATPAVPNTQVDIIITQPKRVMHPAGTIMIRGTAAL